MSTVVLGGGLAGLTAAYALERDGHGVTVLEAQEAPGGACRSFAEDGFTFDLTGHLLHVAREETRQLLEELGLWEELEIHERRAAVVIGGRATPYPVQINTWGLSDEVRRDCLLGFVRAWCQHGEEAAPADFRRWVLGRFGEGLARHFFFPYNEKLYRVRPEELSLDWVGRYVPKPALEEVIDGALGLHRNRVGYNALFRYPRRGGIALLPDAIAGRLRCLEPGNRAGVVDTDARVVETENGRRFSWERLIATIPLPALVDRLRPKPPAEVLEARRALRWVSVLNVALGLEGLAPTDQHWLYFPDPQLPFYRVGFPSNHGDLAPPDCHTVSIEVSMDPGAGDPQAMAEAAERALEAAGYLDRSRILVRRTAILDPAYVVFDHARSGALAIIRRELAGRGVLLAGRWAQWVYSAMEDAMLDGLAAARQIIGAEGA
ncbi:MAG: FAD-dependent oxidoreductase [Acidobacteria bacterium]|nr:FAD-dependent oxidoreductase [Acidobacteriota bacterium]